MKKPLALISSILIGVGSLFLPTMSARADSAPTMTVFSTQSSGVSPYHTATGSDGAIWFTTNSDKIGRITTSGVVTTYSVPTSGVDTYGITKGPDGAIWFTEVDAHSIGRIDNAGMITEYSLPRYGVYDAEPKEITTGIDGNLWFTGAPRYNAVGKISTTGAVTYYPDDNGLHGSGGIVLGSDNAIWFTEPDMNQIGRITATGLMTKYDAPSFSGAYPWSITMGPDGAFWFRASPNTIDRITTSGSITKYSVPDVGVGYLQTGADGAIWFTEASYSRIGRLTTSGSFTDYPVNIPNSIGNPGLAGMMTGSDGTLWFTARTPGAIVRASVTPPDITSPDVSGTPDGQPVNGWYDHDVTISWNASDPDSEATTPAPTLANLEGTHTYTSGPSCDPAGNCATGSLTLSIDKTDPTIDYTISAPEPANAGGWYKAGPVTATFTCSDAVSGIASCPEPVVVDSDTVGQVVTGTAVDNAGRAKNVSVNLKLDQGAPTINYSLSQAPNSTGWNNDNVIVTFTCADELSGVASCSDPVTVGEGANQIVTGTAVDNAGNTTTTSVTLSVDKTKPTIAYSVTSAASPVNGWYSGDVTVNFSCVDQEFLSGIEACSQPVTLSNEGVNQTAFGSAQDFAGNSQTVSVTGLNIDKSLPTVANLSFGASNAKSVSTPTVTLTGQVGDNVSGLASVEYLNPVTNAWTSMAVAGGVATGTIDTSITSFPAGMYLFTVRAWDVAGLSATSSVYLDVYNPTGGYLAGHGFVSPNGATSDPGDFMPVVPSGPNMRGTLDVSVKYATTTPDVLSGNAEFSYGSNCKASVNANDCFFVNFDSFDWMVVPDDGSSAVLQGRATLKLNGASQGSNYPVRLTVLNGASDHYSIQIFPVGSDPDFASPMYQASGNSSGGQLVVHK